MNGVDKSQLADYVRPFREKPRHIIIVPEEE